MHELTDTLGAAQQSPIRQPAIKCRVDDRPIEVPRFTWTSVYPGGEPDYFCAAAICSDGSIVRVRSEASGDFYRQRITDPSQPEQWSTWTLARAGTSTACQVAAARGSASGVVRIYLVSGDPGSRTIYGCESTDDGQTWGDWEVVATPPAGAEVRALAATEDYVVYGVDPQIGDPDDYICVVQKSGGVWSAPSFDGCTYAVVSTASVVREGDYLRITFYCEGTLELRNKSWNTVTSGWADGVVLLAAGSGSNYSYLYPWLLLPDTDVPRYIYMYREYYNGVPVHGRRMLCVTPSRDYLTEVVPLPCTGQMQIVLLKGGGYWYLLGSGEAYRSPVYSGGAGEVVDLSSFVAGFEAQHGGGIRSNGPALGASRLTLWLENSDGAFRQAGLAGTTYAALREGAQLALGLGYHSAAGEECLWDAPWWIGRLAFEDAEGRGRLRVECIDAWGYLDRFRVHRQEVFANQTLGYILQRIWWRVCGETALPATAGLAATAPLFTFQPGETYADIARRICHRSGVVLRFGSNQSDPTGFASVQPVVVAVGTGASTYDYGTGAHPIVRGQYFSGGQVTSHVEVYGTNAFGEQFDTDRNAQTMRDIVLKVVDKEADTNVKAADVALYVLRAAQMARYGGWIEVWVNVAQELWDVVSVTDERANLDVDQRRVVSLLTRYDRIKGELMQRIGLAGV
ncbi:MAG: hypothetical protein M1370_04390 [Bacteroidetes bacterium]|nr:hypothetical protein [Bacteroidota bacterium]